MRRALPILAATVLLIAYASTIRGMVWQWWSDDDMGHGFIVPFVALWIIWREQQSWRDLPIRPSWWGFPVLAVAASIQAAGALGAGLFVESVALVLSIVGIVLCFGGFTLLRAWLFPVFLLIFMLPKLAIFYNQITLPLQLLATQIAGGMLSTAGFSVIRDGNILNVRGHRISIVEACNGIRYLLPLAFLALVFAYLAGAKLWVRVAMLACSVPVAILANALRVAVSGSSPVLSEGMPHLFAGAVIFLLCLGALGALYRLLSLLDAHPA